MWAGTGWLKTMTKPFKVTMTLHLPQSTHNLGINYRPDQCTSSEGSEAHRHASCCASKGSSKGCLSDSTIGWRLDRDQTRNSVQEVGEGPSHSHSCTWFRILMHEASWMKSPHFSQRQTQSVSEVTVSMFWKSCRGSSWGGSLWGRHWRPCYRADKPLRREWCQSVSEGTSRDYLQLSSRVR
jgi:hypothetical protein